MRQYSTQFRNSIVQDIYFLVNSDLIVPQFEGVKMIPENINAILSKDVFEVCQKIDTNNELLEKLDYSRRSKRLGKYCEDLLAAYFTIHPEIVILEFGWQIIENNITKGEIDFILRIGDLIFGLETSFKCYIQFGDSIENWMGPNKKDSLINKLDKVRDRQLPLFKNEKVKEKYGDIEAYFFIKGHLFSNSLQKNSLFQVEFPFVYSDELNSILNSQNRVLLFEKKEWIGQLYFNPQNAWRNKDDLIAIIEELHRDKKGVIIGIRSKLVNQNYFVIRREFSVNS